MDRKEGLKTEAKERSLKGMRAAAEKGNEVEHPGNEGDKRIENLSVFTLSSLRFAVGFAIPIFLLYYLKNIILPQVVETVVSKVDSGVNALRTLVFLPSLHCASQSVL